jgi:hypothetical protein
LCKILAQELGRRLLFWLVIWLVCISRLPNPSGAAAQSIRERFNTSSEIYYIRLADSFGLIDLGELFRLLNVPFAVHSEIFGPPAARTRRGCAVDGWRDMLIRLTLMAQASIMARPVVNSD